MTTLSAFDRNALADPFGPAKDLTVGRGRGLKGDTPGQPGAAPTAQLETSATLEFHPPRATRRRPLAGTCQGSSCRERRRGTRRGRGCRLRPLPRAGPNLQMRRPRDFRHRIGHRFDLSRVNGPSRVVRHAGVVDARKRQRGSPTAKYRPPGTTQRERGRPLSTSGRHFRVQRTAVPNWSLGRALRRKLEDARVEANDIRASVARWVNLYLNYLR